MPADRARPRSHSPPSSSISLLPGSTSSHLGLRPETKPAAFPSAKKRSPCWGNLGEGEYFQLGVPLRAGAGAARGWWGLPSSSFPRLAGKVSMETAALASPEIWGKTDSKKSPSSFLGGGQHSSEERRGACERVLEEEQVSPPAQVSRPPPSVPLKPPYCVQALSAPPWPRLPAWLPPPKPPHYLSTQLLHLLLAAQSPSPGLTVLLAPPPLACPAPLLTPCGDALPSPQRTAPQNSCGERRQVRRLLLGS